MAKSCRGRRRIASRQYRSTPYHLPSYEVNTLGGHFPKKCSRVLEKRDWEEATCSVCMEYPHNAVLLLCSSHNKGCRPYMCGTSYRFSNCLAQFKTAYTKVNTSHDGSQPLNSSYDDPHARAAESWPIEKCDVTELACPLCRGQVKGWTVVEPARECLNAKHRTCMQDNCSFIGNYKDLRKHVKAEHPCARPREIDPILEQKWRTLERDREREDVISTITSVVPGSMVFGDYVIEGPHYGFDTDEDRDVAGRARFFGGFSHFVLLLHAFEPAGNAGHNRRQRGPDSIYHPFMEDDDTVGIRSGSAINFDTSDQENDNGSDEDENGGDPNSGAATMFDNHSRRFHRDRVRRRHRSRGANRRQG